MSLYRKRREQNICSQICLTCQIYPLMFSTLFLHARMNECFCVYLHSFISIVWHCCRVCMYVYITHVYCVPRAVSSSLSRQKEHVKNKWQQMTTNVNCLDNEQKFNFLTNRMVLLHWMEFRSQCESRVWRRERKSKIVLKDNRKWKTKRGVSSNVCILRRNKQALTYRYAYKYLG